MRKIIIAIQDEFTQRLYFRLFREEKFKVLEAKNGKEALDLAKKEVPDIILADVFLPKDGGLGLLKSLKKEVITQRISVVIFAQTEKKEDRSKAMELGAKDFIVGILTPPPEVVLRIRTVLEEQKTYRLLICKENLDKVDKIKELAEDLGYSSTLKCLHCGSPLCLFLIRDLTKGKNYFKVSFICPKCFKI